MNTDVIRRVVVRGRVQGVGFRAFVADEALARSLAGWVRNRRDGSVEALFAGPDDVVTAMIEACGEGPLIARVTAVDAFDAELSALDLRRRGERFSVLPTA
jgi:acylphosphatase